MPEPSPPPVHDFFISHVAGDKEWADWLVWLLESKGYRPVCVRDDLWGANNVALVDQTLRQVSRVIPLLSPAFLSSPLTSSQWTAKFTQDPIGAKRELLPIRVGSVEVTGLLEPVAYVDLVDLDESGAIRKLEDALASLPIQPANPQKPADVARRPDFPYRRVDFLIEYWFTESARVTDLQARLESSPHTVLADPWLLDGVTPSRKSPVPASVRPKCRVVCVGSDTPFRWARSEIQDALKGQQNDTSLRVVPILFPGSPDTKLRAAFDEIQIWADASHAFAILKSAITGEPIGAQEFPPSDPQKPKAELFLEALKRLDNLGLVTPVVLQEGQRQGIADLRNEIYGR